MLTCPCSGRGFTLIELAITLALACILLSVAVPSFSRLIDHRRVDSAATQLATDFRYARSEATARHQGVRVSFHADAQGSCYLLHTGPWAACRCSSTGEALCTADEAVTLKSVALKNDHAVQVHANVGSMLFDPVLGTSTPTGSVTVSSHSGSAIRHVVNLMGRVRSCSPHATISGYPAC